MGMSKKTFADANMLGAKLEHMEVYAFRNKDSFTLKSSSGGAFSEIVLEYMKDMPEKTAVYGASFDEQFNVVHTRITRFNDMRMLRGSKYVQSGLGNSFSLIAEDLNLGIRVLFSGTPCQVNALNQYLSHKKCSTDGLMTVDVLCHGTPSPKLWTDYKNWLEKKYGSNIKEFSFRYKGDGNKRRMAYPMRVCFENGKVLEDTFLLRLYMTLYFSQNAYRNTCYSCRFSNKNRCSDVTVGDFWKYEEVLGKKLLEPWKGMSLILANTNKGVSLVRRIEESALNSSEIYMERCDLKQFESVQFEFGATNERPATSEKFQQDYHQYGIEFVLKRYAGYNVKGFVKHVFKKYLTKLGLK